MEAIEVAVKSYFLFFVSMFLVDVAINQITKKEHRSTLREIWRTHCQMTVAITIAVAIIACLAWFLFKVI